MKCYLLHEFANLLYAKLYVVCFLLEFDLKSPSTYDALNRFIDSQLQPTLSFNYMMNKTVDNICSSFRELMAPREIVKVLWLWDLSGGHNQARTARGVMMQSEFYIL